MTSLDELLSELEATEGVFVDVVVLLEAELLEAIVDEVTFREILLRLEHWSPLLKVFKGEGSAAKKSLIKDFAIRETEF